MRSGVLLDRDGTIIEDYHYVGHIERVQFIPGAIEAIRRFNQVNIPVAIITNQSGVARGFYPESNVHEVHAYITRELALHDAHIDLFLYCAEHPDGNIKGYTDDCDWHKPNTGMACYAAKVLDLDLHQSYVVGDRSEDMTMAGRIGAHAVFVGHDKLKRPPGSRPASFNHFPSLAVAAGYIIERITGVTTSEFPTMNYTNVFSYFVHYSDEIKTALSRIDKKLIEHASDILYKAYSDGSYVYVAGNGGAAAIADHMATDHAKHMAAVGTLYSNIHSLSSNNALTSALANDIGHDAIFSWQLEHFGCSRDDVLVVFSVSGESRNIIAALQRAQEMGMSSIAVTGADSITIDEAALAIVHITIPATNYGVCEDIMSVLQHALAQYIRQTQMSDQAIQSARF